MIEPGLVLFIINGFPRSGKDTFVGMVADNFARNGYRSRNISSIDAVKRAAFLLGWDSVKNDAGRKFLSDLKDLSTLFYDGPMKYMENCITSRAKNYGYVFFFHIREPEEITKFVAKYPQTKTILIHRKAAEMYNNTGDNNVLKYDYDFHIINEGTLKNLKCIADTFFESVTGETK